MTNKLIKGFLSAKEAITHTEMAGRNYEVKLSTPDFTDNDISSWGDWGPMYKIAFKEDQYITVQYKHIETNEVMTERVSPKFVELLSPVVATTRKETPLYFEAFEPTQSMLFRIYLNKEGHVVSVKANSLNQKIPHRFSSQISKAM